MTMWSTRAICFASIAVMLTACSKSEQPAAPAPGKSATKAAEPPPGKPAGKASQLVGTWFRDDSGEVLGLEFGSDNKVVITPVGMRSGALTLDYAVMEGGRVRLTNPNGMTLMFTSTIDGSKMTFEPEGGRGEFNCSKFVKLKSGQTIAQADQEKQQEIAKKRKEMADTIAKEIAKPNLVIRAADEKVQGGRYALDVKGSAGVYEGTAYVDLNPVLARQARVALAPPQNPEAMPGVTVQLGQVLGPPGMQQMNPDALTFQAVMDGGKLKITNGAQVLTSDSGVFNDLTGQFKKDAQERQALVDGFAAKFGAYTRLEGEYRYPNNPNAKPRPVVWGVLRVEGKPALMIADMTRDSNPLPNAFGHLATIELDGKKPYLNIPPTLGGGALAPDGSSESLTLLGNVQGTQLVLKSMTTMTKEQLVNRRATVAEFLDKTLTSPYAICGWYQTDDRPDTPIYPAHMTLVNNGQRNLSGDFGADWIGATCAHNTKVTETLLGAKLVFDATKVTKFDADNFRGGPVGTIDLLWSDAGPTFVGVCKASNGNVLTFFPATSDRAASDHKKLDAAIARNVVFSARTDGYNSGMRPATITLTAGSEPGTLTGKAQFPAKRGGLADVTGKITERDGFAVVDLIFVAKDQSAKAGKLHLWTLTDPTIGGGSASPQITLTGYADWDGFNPRHYMSMSFREVAPTDAPK